MANGIFVSNPNIVVGLVKFVHYWLMPAMTGSIAATIMAIVIYCDIS